jgi:hypothetical protein
MTGKLSIEVGSRKSEAGSQKSEAGCRKFVSLKYEKYLDIRIWFLFFGHWIFAHYLLLIYHLQQLYKVTRRIL